MPNGPNLPHSLMTVRLPQERYKKILQEAARDKRRIADLLTEVESLREELSEHWWYALGQESIDKGDGWLCPYMSEGEYAGPKLVEAGKAEKHPDHDWYRPVAKDL